MKKRSLGIAVAAALGFVAGPVSAADMPVKAPPPVVMPALYNWSGIYIGVEGGAVLGQQSHWHEIFAEPRRPPPAPLSAVADQGGDEVDVGHPLHGGFVGGEVGFNFQAPGSRWVFGIEGDGNWAELEESLTCDPFDGTSFACGSRITSFFTARGRIGYALGPRGDFLVYLTGGGVWARQSARIDTLFVTSTRPFATFEEFKNTWGWTIGGGAEYGITPWLSVKGEVLFVDLSGKDYALAGCNVLVLLECEGAHVQHNFIIARMGLNWRFWWGKGKGPAPVVASY